VIEVPRGEAREVLAGSSRCPGVVPQGAPSDDTQAVSGGVRVAVLVPGAIDNKIVRHAGRRRFGELLRNGVEIYEYQAALLHAKTMVIDGVWATIGSTNLDNRSFALNDELNLVIYDRTVASRLEKIFADDLAYSRKIEYAQWRTRGVLNRLLEIFAWPFLDQF